MSTAREVLTSHDPACPEKLARIEAILSALGPDDRFFSLDEYGPFAVELQGNRALAPPGQVRTISQWRKSKGSLIETRYWAIGCSSTPCIRPSAAMRSW